MRNRRWFSGLAVALSMACGVTWAEDFKTRAIIRAGVDRNGRVHGELAQLTGLKNATSINYRILLLQPDGKEKFVDEDEYTFKFGEQFRLEIEADNDLYLYVFHEGPDGKRTVLVPDKYDEGYVPLVRKGEKTIIPDDGTYFEFVEPPGTERLLVYATPEKQPTLTPEDAFREQDKQQEIKLKSQQDAVLNAEQERGPKKVVKEEDPKKVAQVNESLPEFRLRGLRWEPPVSATNDTGKTVLRGSYDERRPSLFVEIAMKTGSK